jgi:hypothetical protein
LHPLNAEPESGRHISFDPVRRALRLHFHFGSGKSGFEMHRAVPWVRPSWGKNAASLPSLGEAGSSREKPVEFLDKSVGVTQERYQKALTMPLDKNSIEVPKTSLGMEGISFVPFEILGIGLDEDSISHVRALGFTKTGDTAAAASGTRIVRFMVPSSSNATSAQELLTKQLPGHRFELNRIYRLYRAAMQPSSTGPDRGMPAAAGESCPPERCFARNVIQWQDELSACARGARVGVIDTRFDGSHPAFKGARIQTANFVPAGKQPAPDWHGTGVLALLAGRSDSGTPGLIPGADFYAASIFFTEPNGAMATDTASLMQALAWMRENGVKIVNMSFAGPHDGPVKDEIEKLSNEGVVLVAAAGNDGPAADPAYPAAYPQVIAVTAVTKDRLNYRYANRGDHIDVAAPGVDIWTAVPGARQGFHSGTSFAAPHVTAIVALLPRDGLTGNKNDLLDSLPVVHLGPQGRNPVYGRGLLVAPSFCSPPSESVASAAP